MQTQNKATKAHIMKLINNITDLENLGLKANDVLWVPETGKCGVHIGRYGCAVGVTKKLAADLSKT